MMKFLNGCRIVKFKGVLLNSVVYGGCCRVWLD